MYGACSLGVVIAPARAMYSGRAGSGHIVADVRVGEEDDAASGYAGGVGERADADQTNLLAVGCASAFSWQD
ncbi:uncharacterized protein BKA78DRAFT_316972 [Phyllosticta capitalensis]|uniref:uncharacterized protein n=1 Tax=Phyllosticta capitalensis TaxID=121624 RepID=UPI00312CDAD3